MQKHRLEVQQSTDTDNSTCNSSQESGLNYTGICQTLQPVLIESCSTLVYDDGSLTPNVIPGKFGFSRMSQLNIPLSRSCDAHDPTRVTEFTCYCRYL